MTTDPSKRLWPEFSMSHLVDAYGLGPVRAVFPVDKDPAHPLRAAGPTPPSREITVWALLMVDGTRLVVKTHTAPYSHDRNTNGISLTRTIAGLEHQHRARMNGVRTPAVLPSKTDELAVAVPCRSGERVQGVSVQEFVDNAGWPVMGDAWKVREVAGKVGGLLAEIHGEGGDPERQDDLWVSPHGDFRPENLIFDTGGRVWAVDFTSGELGSARIELGNTAWRFYAGHLRTEGPEFSRPLFAGKDEQAMFVKHMFAEYEHGMSEQGFFHVREVLAKHLLASPEWGGGMSV